MMNAREWHAAALMPNGKALVTGGEGQHDALGDAELYDPATNTWSSAGSMSNPHRALTATTLANGKVLVTRGTALRVDR